MGVVRELYQLQQVESELEEKRHRLGELAASLGQMGDVIRAREGVVEIEGVLDRLRIQLRDLELEIAGLGAKLKQNQERLYGGRVRNPKELSSLQEEAAALRRRQAEMEDHQLELMIAFEEEEAELAERQARLRQIQTTWEAEQAALRAETERLESRLAELEHQRRAKRALLRAADLELYDDLRKRLGGVAVAPLKRGICQACGVDVPTRVAQAVGRGDDLYFCPVCSRLLHGE